MIYSYISTTSSHPFSVGTPGPSKWVQEAGGCHREKKVQMEGSTYAIEKESTDGGGVPMPQRKKVQMEGSTYAIEKQSTDGGEYLCHRERKNRWRRSTYAIEKESTDGGEYLCHRERKNRWRGSTYAICRERKYRWRRHLQERVEIVDCASRSTQVHYDINHMQDAFIVCTLVHISSFLVTTLLQPQLLKLWVQNLPN